jgi:hypothetical protein
MCEFFECKEALHYNKLKEMAKGLARKEENLKFQEQQSSTRRMTCMLYPKPSFCACTLEYSN